MRSWGAIIGICLLATSSLAGLQSSSYTIRPVDVNSGGAHSTSANYALTASTAQVGGVGAIGSADYSFFDGFWHPSVDESDPPGPIVVIGGNLDGACRAGNRVVIRARITPEELWPQITQVEFQFRPTGMDPWMPIPPANANHPNPDISYPFFVHWNLSMVADGDYDVRALASDAGGIIDPDPEFVTFTRSSNCGHRGRLNMAMETEVLSPLLQADNNNVSGADSERHNAIDLTLGAGALSSDMDLTMTFRSPEDFASTLGSLGGIGHFVDLELLSGQMIFANGRRAWLSFDYPDADNDGLVDGLDVPESSLGLYWYDGSAWQPLADSTVASFLNRVVGTIDHFTPFAVLSTPPPPNSAIEWVRYD